MVLGGGDTSHTLAGANEAPFGQINAQYNIPRLKGEEALPPGSW